MFLFVWFLGSMLPQYIALCVCVRFVPLLHWVQKMSATLSVIVRHSLTSFDGTKILQARFYPIWVPLFPRMVNPFPKMVTNLFQQHFRASINLMTPITSRIATIHWLVTKKEKKGVILHSDWHSINVEEKLSILTI